MASVTEDRDEELTIKPGVIFDYEFVVGKTHRIDTGEPGLALTFTSGDQELAFGFNLEGAQRLEQQLGEGINALMEDTIKRLEEDERLAEGQTDEPE